MALTREDLEALRKLSTPTVSNAIELFNLRPRNVGFLSPEVRCLFPELGVMVGHAVTARFSADKPSDKAASRFECWKAILQVPEPRVMVMQDLDVPAGIGAYFGEVQTTIHRRLGCIGVVTNGHVRDLDEVKSMKFHVFAGGVCVSHAYVHLVDFGGPVKVAGALVRTGDLIHADQHGVLLVPEEKSREIPAAAARVAEREQRIMAHCQSPDFTLEGIKKLVDS